MHTRTLASFCLLFSPALVVPAASGADARSSKYPDPHVAGPTIYRPILANESVRMYEVTFLRGAKIPLHHHPDHVAFVVSGGKLSVTQPGAAAQVFDLKTGDVAFLAAQVHEAANVGGTEVKLAQVELRKWGAPAPQGKQPHVVDGKIYQSLFENERVRVYAVTFEPKGKIGMHTHPDHAVYVLEGGKLRVSAPGAAPQEMELKPGDGAYMPAQMHTAENLSANRVKLIVYELKPPGGKG
jgi:quercetin dioxygenase-like cupin family protein